jgi:hypothetical protein
MTLSPPSEIQLHIVVEVISRLKMAQQMKSLLVDEHLLVDFLLDQILLLKVIVAQQGVWWFHTLSWILWATSRPPYPIDKDIFDRQPLMSLDCRLASAKTYVGRKPIFRIARCRVTSVADGSMSE